MSDGESSSPASTSESPSRESYDTRTTVEGTPDSVEIPDYPQSASSWFDNFLRDDSTTIYSYFSTWSTNYTMSNLPGPGRLLGNLLSSAGSSLEQRLGRRPRVMPDRDLWWQYAQGERERVCNKLLVYAGSNNSFIQIMAFNYIIRNAFEFSSFLAVVETFCQKRNEPIEVVTFSWQRPGVDYSLMWLYYYTLASRCLSPLSCPVMEAISKFQQDREIKVDYSACNIVLSCCRDVPDTTLAIDFLSRSRHWGAGEKGLVTFVTRNKFTAPILFKLATAFTTRFEVASYSAQSGNHIYIDAFPQFAKDFMLGMWAAVRTLEPDESDKLSEDESQMMIWVEVLKLHCISRSRIGWILASHLSSDNSNLGKTWKEACHGELPGPEHARLRDRLLRLEETHGDAIRKRFPPED